MCVEPTTTEAPASPAASPVSAVSWPPGPGEPAPWFGAPTPSRPDFTFSSMAGRYVLLAFLSVDPARRAQALETVARNRDLMDDVRLSCFLVIGDPPGMAAARDGPGLRWFLDPDGEIAQLYGRRTPDGLDAPGWVLIDPSLRVLLNWPDDDPDALFARLRRLPGADDHAGVPLNAPVLIVPRVLERDMCRRLIGIYGASGGEVSGVMREIDGKTVGFVDDFKKRRDAQLEDPELRQALRARIARRLSPEITKAFQFEVTRIERYIVACYDAADGGYFRAHRDNTSPATAHRKFAVSINLNAEDFEGGDLRFPEFGQRTYRPPTGGAVVFSCSLLHEATPVTRGTRYAFLPFLFDEAGEAVRSSTDHLIQNPAAAS